MSWRADVTLHRVSLTRSFERFQLGRPPVILRDGDPWLPPESRKQLDEAVDADLAEQGMLRRDGQPRDDFYDALVALARPELSYTAWVASHDVGRYSLAVSRVGRDCVLAFRREQYVRLSAANPDAMTEALIRQLPEFDAGSGESVTVPEAQAPWAHDDADAPPARLSYDARRLDRLHHLPRYGGGQIGVDSADGDLRVEPLRYLDTSEGRWLFAVNGDGPANRWVTAVPATQYTFARKLGELTG